jgi:O-6-methylguanine DNA methyltransferase
MSRPPPSPKPQASSDFVQRVLQLVSRIPAGQVATYGDLAKKSGRPGAARAVGRLMATAPRRGLPYHRVVAANGRLGGYGGSEALKAGLLAAEGLTIRRGRIADFDRNRWR